MRVITILFETMKAIVLGVTAILLIVIGVFIGRQFLPNTFLANDATQSPTIQAQQVVNKTFSFPVTDSNDNPITNIAYTITSVDKQNQVIIKGQRANAVAGRTFFLVNLKLTNTSSQPIQLNSRDYVRISTGNGKELYAPEMYNDPIIIQPISTEYTHIGFPIDSTEKNITLHIGQLTGPKTDIPITFK